MSEETVKEGVEAAAAEAIKEGRAKVVELREKAEEVIHKAADRAREAADKAKEWAEAAPEQLKAARERAQKAYDTTAPKVRQVVQEQPIAVLAGGIALGFVVGWLLAGKRR